MPIKKNLPQVYLLQINIPTYKIYTKRYEYLELKERKMLINCVIEHS